MSGSPIVPFSLSYRKTKKTFSLKPLVEQFEHNPEDLEQEYNAFHITDLQNYNPLYHVFFDLNETNYNRITTNHVYRIQDLHHVVEMENQTVHEKPVFIKFSPLLDSLRFMTGRYANVLDHILLPTLPSMEKEEEENTPKKKIQKKLMDPNNASYVDQFFSFLSSVLLNHHGFVHGIDYYGSFLGIQEKYKANITDDVEYLHSSTFFRENNHRLFSVDMENMEEYQNYGSRKNKMKLLIGEDAKVDLLSLDVTELEEEKGEQEIGELEEVYENKEIGKEESEDSSENTSNNSETNYSSDEESEEEEEWETESEEDEEDEEEDEEEEEEEEEEEDNEEKYAYIQKFPVQLICLEKCKGTLDELFEKQQINAAESVACMFQIIMTLLTYQKAFAFTHNDLHTNNIMYIPTDVPYLYYRYKSRIYQVPTFGKIYKLIDFGRGVYKYKDRTFFSDSFAPGGDASTQYNTEPYYNEKKKRVESNPSFDLCRLGTSIYDFVIPEDNMQEKDMDEFQKTIHRWCCDDQGKNLLYKRNGEERYPNFKLYKMIARSVHKHTPEAQLEFPLFAQFCVNTNPLESLIMDIDAIPNYI